MLPVAPQPEWDRFDAEVRRPGRDSLAQLAAEFGGLEAIPTKKLKKLWRGECLAHAYESYDGMCAYTAQWIDRATCDPTIDHFVAQAAGAWGRVLAYEWANYRLSALPPNRNKSSDRILDPFEVELDDFQIEFVTFQVIANPALPAARWKLVDETIKALGLREERFCASKRRHVQLWERHEIPFSALATLAPFVARELQRVGGTPLRPLVS